ncbi:MAG: hypothetical protein HFJ46_01795 [Clostridia bacterium]|nr:hypothetical protein [Clostridia bacterium]
MIYFISLLKDLFNSYKFEHSLAFECYNSTFNKKELSFIMYAQNLENEENNYENSDYITEIDDSNKKTSLLDRFKALFNKQKALPDPNREYTMDDWINAQKNPISRMFSNIMEASTHAIQNILSKMQSKKIEKQNIPTTPSQNFEMSNKSTAEDRGVINPIFPKPIAKQKPFVPLKNTPVVEEISIDDSELVEEKNTLESNSKAEKSEPTEPTNSGLVVENINLEMPVQDKNDRNDDSR